MRWVQHQQSGTVSVDLAYRPQTTVRATVRAASGAVLETPFASLDATAATLTAAVVAGSTTLTLSDTVSVIVGRQYLLGGPESFGGESVLVTSRTGLSVTLARPVTIARAVGATFQGTRVSVAVSAISTQTVARGYRVEIVDDTTGEVTSVPFDVTRYAPVSQLTQSMILDFDPAFRKRLAAGAWVPALIARAHEILLGDLASHERHPGGFAGVVDLQTAHAYLVRALVAETDTSAEGIAYRDDLRGRYRQERDRVLSASFYDEAGSGSTTPGGGGPVGFRLVRG